MHEIRFSKQKESIEDQIAAGRVNPCLEVELESGQVMKVSAGYEDRIKVFEDGVATLVLSYSIRHDYAGLEVFVDGERVDRVYQDHCIDNGLDLDYSSDINIALQLCEVL